ncbi:MAG: helix-turn-helix domain-containing protein [Oscillospiraceae bacterium]|nr:helix-turn-helix domain-containing protein [Oscillospiraceae bacterium]
MNRIRELRKHMKLTQKELAKHLQIADSTLSYWEIGKYEPDSEALLKLSRFFKVPIDYILIGDFEKWDINVELASYTNENTVQIIDSNMKVSENNIEYISNNRNEFEGLTKEEIEKLSDYAQFIKSQRNKK